MMPNMTTEEILHLGRLSRIALTETEVTAFGSSLEAILAYVSVVSTVAKDGAAPSAPLMGARFNVLRPDEVTHSPASYTDVLLAAMPKRDGQFLSVKKILTQPE